GRGKVPTQRRTARHRGSWPRRTRRDSTHTAARLSAVEVCRAGCVAGPSGVLPLHDGGPAALQSPRREAAEPDEWSLTAASVVGSGYGRAPGVRARSSPARPLVAEGRGWWDCVAAGLRREAGWVASRAGSSAIPRPRATPALRRHDVQSREVRAVTRRVTRQQAQARHGRVRADVEVRQRGTAPAARAPVGEEALAG